MKEKSESAGSFTTCAVDNEFVKGYDRARVRPHRPFADSRRKSRADDNVSPCTDTANEHPSFHGLFKTGTHTHTVCLSKSESEVQSPKNDAPLTANLSHLFPLKTARISNYLNLSKRNLLKLFKATKLLLYLCNNLHFLFFYYICRYNTCFIVRERILK